MLVFPECFSASRVNVLISLHNLVVILLSVISLGLSYLIESFDCDINDCVYANECLSILSLSHIGFFCILLFVFK
jgi:hypothetical protein